MYAMIGKVIGLFLYSITQFKRENFTSFTVILNAKALAILRHRKSSRKCLITGFHDLIACLDKIGVIGYDLSLDVNKKRR